jgi:competence ComEA-like helix-hairpin-helix protein
MSNRVYLLLLLIFLLPGVFSYCEEGQIDINSASLEELQKIVGVGPATAQNIINERPFNSLDDLLRVTYIGEVRLAAIKEQGLACVGEIEEEEEEEVNESDGAGDEENESDYFGDNLEEIYEEESEEENEEDEEVSISLLTSKLIEESKSPIVLERISLNPESQNIKKEENTTFSDAKENYSLYGLIGFCVLIGILFTVKILKNKKYNKNEFTEK